MLDAEIDAGTGFYGNSIQLRKPSGSKDISIR